MAIQKNLKVKVGEVLLSKARKDLTIGQIGKILNWSKTIELGQRPSITIEWAIWRIGGRGWTHWDNPKWTGLKQKWEAFLDESFPFNESKTIVLNSLQATVIMAIPSCPSQNRMSEVAPKSMSQFSDTLLHFCGCPSQTFLAKSSFTPGILISSKD